MTIPRPLARPARRVAERIDRDDFEWLGIGNTRRLSKAVNRVRHGADERRRRRLFDESFGSLLHELGPLDNDPGEMRDGYLLDTSRKLPHVDVLIDSAEAVIAERGGGRHSDRRKPFIVDLRRDRDLVKHPAFLDFALSAPVLKVAATHLNQCPLLSRTRPPGVRLTESSSRYDPHAGGPYRESQLYHRDLHDRPLVYVIVLVRDVTERSGPFTFLPTSASDRVALATGNEKRGRPYRLTDKEVYRHVAREEAIPLSYPRGTVLFIDSSRCFHYGSRDCSIPRYQVMYAFTSPCRTDLSEYLMKSKRYPLTDGDPRLRKLALARSRSTSR
jgi:hypothetical protein